MTLVLSEIDDLTRPLHSHLTADHQCLFLREYTSGRGYAHSETNSLILNLKKNVDRRTSSDWPYKERAIRQAANELRSSLNPKWLAAATLVPIPPSKDRGDPLYDDRMVRVLRAMTTTSPLDIRDIVSQVRSTMAVHRTDATRDPAAIAANYQLDKTLVSPEPSMVGLFDDVLTTGAHFIAATSVLRTVWPAASFVGIFIARRLFPEPDESPFDR